MRDGAFNEAFLDGVGAMIRDQLQVGIDLPTDGHLWYDRHQGFISSFLLYPAYRIQGLEVRPQVNPLIEIASKEAGWEGGASAEVFAETWNMVAVTGPVRRGTMRLAELWKAAQSVSPKLVKTASGMGPTNLAAWLTDERYHDDRRLWFDLAEVYRAEFQDCVKAGAKVIQLDDCGFALHPPEKYPLIVETLNRALDGVDAYRIYHICHLAPPAKIGTTPYPAFFGLIANDLDVNAFEFSYGQTGFPDEHLSLWRKYPNDKDLGLGAISVKNFLVESPLEVAAGVRKALEYVEPERIYLSTDCGLFSYPRVMARAKLRALVEGAAMVRQEFGAREPAAVAAV
jgi:methionine synthase II (cobalamin-independent)